MYDLAVAADDIARLITAVDRQIRVLALRGVPPVADLVRLEVARISVGSAFAPVGYGPVAHRRSHCGSARDLLEHQTYGFSDIAKAGRGAGAFDR